MTFLRVYIERFFFCLGISGLAGATHASALFAKKSSPKTLAELRTWQEKSFDEITASAKSTLFRHGRMIGTESSNARTQLSELRSARELRFADLLSGNSTKKEVSPRPEKPQENFEDLKLLVKADAHDEKIQISVQKNATKTTHQPKILSTEIPIKPLLHDPAESNANLLVLRATLKGDQVSFSPESFRIPTADEEFLVELLDASGRKLKPHAELSLFARDPSIVELSVKALRGKTLKEGQTEIYVVHNGRASSVSVRVGSKLDAPMLNPPEELFAINDLGSRLQKNSAHAVYGNKVSVDQTASNPEASQIVRRLGSAFSVKKENIERVDLRLRVVDERSNVSEGRTYGLAKIIAHVVGTELKVISDSLGYVVLPQLPAESRFLIALDDPLGRVRSTVVELATGGEDSEAQVRMSRHLALENYEMAVGTEVTAQSSSLCGVARDSRIGAKNLSGISVATDIPARGPFYFSSFGLIDARSDRARSKQTAGDGRFCFFDISPGPIALHFFTDDMYITTILTAVYPGKHHEEDFFLNEIKPVRARLATQASAREQLSSDPSSEDLKEVDMVDLVTLGSGASMSHIDDAMVEVSDGAVLHNGRVFAVTESSDFESTMYALEASSLSRGQDNITPLIPRGFIEDLAFFAQVDFAPEKGVLIAEHRQFADQDGEVDFRLLDSSGNPVGDGWYYSDQPTTKAIFFNLEPDRYVIVAQNKDGVWLSSEVVYVFDETLSYVSTGSGLRYRKSRN